jgi:hypothetical protein
MKLTAKGAGAPYALDGPAGASLVAAAAVTRAVLAFLPKVA